MEGLRERITYANVVATLALFLAIGGGAYAVSKVGPGDIKRNAVKSRHVAPNAIRGGDLRESSLGTVPNAARLSGRRLGEIVTRIDFSGFSSGANDAETQRIGLVKLTYGCLAAGGLGELTITGERQQQVVIPFDSSHTIGNGGLSEIRHDAGALEPDDQVFFEDSVGLDRGTFWIIWREPTRTVSVHGGYTVTEEGGQANCDLNGVATIAG